jgi:hypothetical protein
MASDTEDLNRIINQRERPSRVTVPERCDPRAKLVFAEMRRQGKTYADVEWEAGVLLSTLKSWRGHSAPGLLTLDACLGSLGWSLVPVARYERLPKAIQEGLDELSKQWAGEEPLLHQLLANCCGAPFIVRTGRTDRMPRKPLKGAREFAEMPAAPARPWPRRPSPSGEN